MPTRAQADYQDSLMRQAIENARLAASQRMSSEAAKANMYGADRGLEGMKYGADTSLAGTMDTNKTRLAATETEQTGANARAETAIKPHMEALRLDERKYYDTRNDRMDNPDYVLSRRIAQALGGGAPSTPSAPIAPTLGGSVQAPAGFSTNADARQRATNRAPSGEDNLPGSMPYDMTNFTGDVQDIADRANAVKESSGGGWNMGADATPSQGAWVRDKDGNLTKVASPSWSSSTTRNAGDLAAKVKSMIAQEAGAVPQPAGASAAPAAAAPAASVQDDLARRAVEGYMRTKFGNDPAAEDERQLRNALRQRALTGDPRSIAALKATGDKLADGITADPTMEQAEKAKAESAGVTGAVVDVMPDIKALEAAVASPTFMASDKDKQQISERINDILLKARASGRGDQIQAIKDEILRRLRPAMERSGAQLPWWAMALSPQAVLATNLLGGKTNRDVSATVEQALK